MVLIVTELAQQRWLTAIWSRVQSFVPPPPAAIVEVGCGRLGGFVPMLRDAGYEGLGIDPVAPEGPNYRQLEFEQAELPEQVDAFIACTSLHHVSAPGAVLEKVAAALRRAGLLIVVEWDWERFDEATARWCFERLGSTDPDGWLRHRRDEWAGSGEPWDAYLRGWAEQHGIHSAGHLLQELDRRFTRLVCERGPYFFEDLHQISEADELDAINAGLIRATRIDYVGRAG